MSCAERTRETPTEGKKGGRQGAEADRSKQRPRTLATGSRATEDAGCLRGRSQGGGGGRGSLFRQAIAMSSGTVRVRLGEDSRRSALRESHSGGSDCRCGRGPGMQTSTHERVCAKSCRGGPMQHATKHARHDQGRGRKQAGCPPPPQPFAGICETSVVVRTPARSADSPESTRGEELGAGLAAQDAGGRNARSG